MLFFPASFLTFECGAMSVARQCGPGRLGQQIRNQSVDCAANAVGQNWGGQRRLPVENFLRIVGAWVSVYASCYGLGLFCFSGFVHSEDTSFGCPRSPNELLKTHTRPQTTKRNYFPSKLHPNYLLYNNFNFIF